MVALAAGKEAFSDYSHKFSPQKFTQPQLFACLVLKEFERKDYRGIHQLLLDYYYVHNTFRSAGRLDLNELGKLKVEVYKARYDSFRTGLSFIPKFIDASCTEDLRGVTFAFVCVDKGSSRAGIFDLLIAMGIPFIDVGMGLDRKRGPLNGMLRVTNYPTARAREMRDKGLAELVDNPDNIYRTNIQIGELNALNACLAVLRFKQLRGFYFDEANFYHLLFGLGDQMIHGDAEAQKDRLERLLYVPKTLEPGILYVSEEFGAAVHLSECSWTG